MILRTSSNKVNPFSNMFRFTFRRNIGIIALLSILFLLVCPAYMLVNLQNLGGSPDYFQTYFNDWANGFALFCGIASAVSVIGLNLLNFSFMFRKNASDFTDSLPITRSELFISKTLSGFFLSIIPTLVSFFGFGILLAFENCLGLVKNLLVYALYIILSTAVFSAISMIFIVASGNVFDFLVSFVGINTGLILLGLIYSVLFESLLVGFPDSSVLPMINAFSPVFYTFYRLGSLVLNNSVSVNFGFVIKCLLMTALFIFLSIILYKKRKTESTGKAFAYKFIYTICAFLVALCSSFAFGSIFENNFNSFHYDSAVFYVFALIGALFSSVIYGAVTFRGFKTVKKSLIIGAVSFAVLVASVFFISADITGYNKNVPNVKEIKGVTITYDGEEIDYKNPEFAVNLHKKIVFTDGVISEDMCVDEFTSNIRFSYRLKNGKKLERNYWIYNKNLSSELFEIIKSDERFDGIVGKLKKAKPPTIEFWYDEKDYSVSSYLTYDEAMAFVNFYRLEINEDGKKPILNSQQNYNFNFENGEYWSCVCFPYSENLTPKTNKFIKSLNLQERSPSSDEKICK
ncbi:MAG: hypothetical protein MJ090_02845 [Clostridia bacterium]|nr:hypothetical protein [Clostridia bacterium]